MEISEELGWNFNRSSWESTREGGGTEKMMEGEVVAGAAVEDSPVSVLLAPSIESWERDQRDEESLRREWLVFFIYLLVSNQNLLVSESDFFYLFDKSYHNF
jgi:coproporphyrinogen III oxidase